MKQKDISNTINNFLKLNESDIFPYFLPFKSRNNDKLNIQRSNVIIQNSRLNTIDSCSNTQFFKANYLTPFQKILQNKKEKKLFHNKKMQYLNHNNIELAPIINSKKKKNNFKNLFNNFNTCHISPKEYINKIKIYKLKNNKYNRIKEKIYNLEINSNKNKLKNKGNDSFSNEKNKINNNIKKGNLKNKRINRKLSKNNSNLNIDNEFFLSITKKLKLYKLEKKDSKKIINKKIINNDDNFDDLFYNIKKDIISSRRNTKNHNICNNNNYIKIKTLENLKDNYNILKRKFYFPLYNNNTDNSINGLKYL